MSTPHVGDIGTVISFNTKEDLTLATVAALKVEKPSGTQVTWTGYTADTTKVEYITVAGDFDEAGTYKLHAYVELPSWTGSSNQQCIHVRALFE